MTGEFLFDGASLRSIACSFRRILYLKMHPNEPCGDDTIALQCAWGEKACRKLEEKQDKRDRELADKLKEAHTALGLMQESLRGNATIAQVRTMLDEQARVLCGEEAVK